MTNIIPTESAAPELNRDLHAVCGAICELFESAAKVGHMVLPIAEASLKETSAGSCDRSKLNDLALGALNCNGAVLDGLKGMGHAVGVLVFQLALGGDDAHPALQAFFAGLEEGGNLSFCPFEPA
jgi:hypothetical protein